MFRLPCYTQPTARRKERSTQKENTTANSTATEKGNPKAILKAMHLVTWKLPFYVLIVK